jgi:hypothetical protein
MHSHWGSPYLTLHLNTYILFQYAFYLGIEVLHVVVVKQSGVWFVFRIRHRIFLVVHHSLHLCELSHLHFINELHHKNIL